MAPADNPKIMGSQAVFMLSNAPNKDFAHAQH